MNLAMDWNVIDESLDEQKPNGGSEKAAIRYQRISSAELDTSNYELTYLVEDILVDQQPCLIAGPHKSLKTNLLIDLSISLAIADDFWGCSRFHNQSALAS